MAKMNLLRLFDEKAQVRDVVSLIVAINSYDLRILFKLDVGNFFKEFTRLIFVQS